MPLQFEIREGQVGQESNLQPAVLEIGLARLLRSLGVAGAEYSRLCGHALYLVVSHRLYG
jgi:hypothetical protein